MRTSAGVTYLHSDHPSTSPFPFTAFRASAHALRVFELRACLGSTSATSGASTGTQVYYPFGGVRTKQNRRLYNTIGGDTTEY